MRAIRWFLTMALATCSIHTANAAVAITEWMYQGGHPNSRDFFELTNLGREEVDLTGWTYKGDLPNFTKSFTPWTLGRGESLIVTELAPNNFRNEWDLPDYAKITSLPDQLDRSDVISIYDADNVLVDRLTYNDQGTGSVAGPYTFGVSANATFASLRMNNASLWLLSAEGDDYGTFRSRSGDLGNPGKFLIIVPEPTALAISATCLGTVLLTRRRRG